MRLSRSNLIFKELATSHRCEALKTPTSLERLTPNLRVVTAFGGAGEDRTPDLLRARQALSQLSYGPDQLLCALHPDHADVLVGLAGVEPATSPLSGVRSNQLSYRPNGLFYGP